MTVTASGYERKEREHYETEEWATDACVRSLQYLGAWWGTGIRIWEPAAGSHKMVRALRQHGAHVLASDIHDYGAAHDGLFDFLSEADPSFPCRSDIIMTNPPYGKGNRTAVAFIETALVRGRSSWVAMLLTAKFDFGKTRKHLFADNPRFAAKVALLDRISWEGNGQTGTEDHAWYIWRPAGHMSAPSVCLYEQKVKS